MTERAVASTTDPTVGLRAAREADASSAVPPFAVVVELGAPPKATRSNLRSSVILLVALVSFTAMTVLIKVAGRRIPLVEILLVRQLVMQILIIPFCLDGFPRVLFPRRPLLQVARGLLQLGAMGTSFAAVIHLPLALAMTISFSNALFVTIGAGALLRERVGAGRWAAALIGFAGVAIMLRPSEGGSLYYSVLAVLGAAFSAASALSLRLFPDAERVDTILTYQALVLIAAFAVPTALVWVTPSLGDLVLLILVGVTGTIGQWMLTSAYQHGEAAALAPLDFVRLLLAVACGLVFFGDVLDAPMIVGAIILVAATGYTFYANAGPMQRPRGAPGERR